MSVMADEVTCTTRPLSLRDDEECYIEIDLFYSPKENSQGLSTSPVLSPPATEEMLVDLTV